VAARRAMRSGRNGGRRPGGTNWSRFVSTGLTTVAGGTKVLFVTFTLDNPGISETVRRTRGTLLVKSDQTGTAENQFGAFGMIQANEVALTAGAASIPGPVTNASDEGWFLWMPMLATQSTASNPAPQFTLIHFDSKAMRTVDDGFGLALMVENAHATQGLQVAIAMSLLSSRR